MTLDINGTIIEADTLKELNKLAKKEEKRQAAVRQERDVKLGMAHDHAVRNLGAVVVKVANNRRNLRFIVDVHAEISPNAQDESYQDVRLLDGWTKEGLREGRWTLSQHYRVLAIAHSNDRTLAVKTEYLFSDGRTETPEWQAVGFVDDLHACETIPPCIAALLDAKLTEQETPVQEAA